MQVKIVESFYAEDIVFDVPTYQLQQVRNPLYIGARVGQVARVHKLMADKKIGGVSIGAWELGEYGYLDAEGRLNKTNILKHGTVFVARAERIPAEFRDAYTRLLEAIEAL